ncbi:hypothetical protein [Mucilaginibacter glaciei]|uniref:Lipoprotein n=1 Tax=Mucilaginibacter glaciei TaxID=2772109 RepID=A0A926S3P5_9SPHI|nr:hypothetical protein [Mucilaginibacter glaciei]MBD1395438.1 hypothetical protein [Mucilaginibacter glaciei]
MEQNTKYRKAHKFKVYYILLYTIVSSCQISTQTIGLSKAKGYLSLDLKKENQVLFYEYRIRPDYLYPKIVYIKFKCNNPELLIQKMNLIPARPLPSRYSSRNYDYSLAQLIKNFWQLGSTKNNISKVKSIETEKLNWWYKKQLPSNTFGGGYSEREKKVVPAKDASNGRLIFYTEHQDVYIEIDLLSENR